VPAFAEVVVRNPLTLEPVAAGQQGLVQVCSVLPTSFPGFLVLTDDMAEIIDYDECPCGRRGTSFRFAGRVPKAEVADAAMWKPLATNTGRVTICMNDLMPNPAVHSPQEITCAAQQVREIAREKEIAPHAVLEVFEQWAAALDGRELREVPGLAFLRLWLRRGTLEPILLRELGPDFLNGGCGKMDVQGWGHFRWE